MAQGTSFKFHILQVPLLGLSPGNPAQGLRSLSSWPYAAHASGQGPIRCHWASRKSSGDGPGSPCSCSEYPQDLCPELWKGSPGLCQSQSLTVRWALKAALSFLPVQLCHLNHACTLLSFCVLNREMIQNPVCSCVGNLK